MCTEKYIEEKICKGCQNVYVRVELSKEKFYETYNNDHGEYSFADDTNVLTFYGTCDGCREEYHRLMDQEEQENENA